MKKQTDMIAGIHSITEAFRAHRRDVLELYVAKKEPSHRLIPILRMAEERKTPIFFLPKDQLEKKSGTTSHQMIAAKVSAYPFFSADARDLLSVSTQKESAPFLLFLDGIQDPHNLGAIIRTAFCMGVDGVVIPKDRAATETPTVSRISAGALEHIRLVEVTNLARSIEEIQKEGVWATGLMASSPTMLADGNYAAASAIVMGSEEKGIRPLVQKQCDYLCSIPQAGNLDSMNVSVATAIALYEVVRQRRGEK